MLQPGTVIYLEIQFRQRTRNKYLIVLEWTDPVHCLIINSEINAFFGFGAFQEFYVNIDVATHTFLDHDSHIDCNETFRLPLDGLTQELTANPATVVGQISNDVRNSIITAINGTPGLSPDEKSRFVNCLTDD